MKPESKLYPNKRDCEHSDMEDMAATIATLSGVKKALESFVAGEQQIVDRYKPLCTIDPAEVRATHRLEAFQLVLRCFPDHL